MENGEKVQLPFSLLTNGGGDTEKVRSDLVNKRMFGRTEPEGPNDTILNPNQMICCHTPLRDYVPQYGDKFVLVTGLGNVMQVCAEYGLRKAIHVEELYALIPQLSPLSMKE